MSGAESWHTEDGYTVTATLVHSVMNEKQIIRFFTKFVVVENGCWEWQGDRGPRYGQFYINPRKLMAHRLAYELFRGDIPEGLQLDHLCRFTFCIRPDHLEPVTGRENIHRSNAPAGRNARKTHCIRGHEFTPLNTYRDSRGNRQCQACNKARKARYYEEVERDRRRIRRQEAKAAESCS